MADIASLMDDFYLAGGLDYAKWTPTVDSSGVLTILPAGGLKLESNAANNGAQIQANNYMSFYGSIVSCQIDSMVAAGDGLATFMIIRADGSYFKWEFNGTSAKGYWKAPDPATAVLKFTHTWVAANFKYVRLRHNRFVNSVFWESSRDGVAWTTRHNYQSFTATNWQYKIRISNHDPSTPVSAGEFTVRRVNTMLDLNYGPDYLTCNFYGMNTTNGFVVGQNYGPFRSLVGTGSSIVIESGADKALQISSAWNVHNLVRTDMRQKIRDVDMTCDVKLASQAAVPGGSTRGAEDCPKLSWRVQGTTTFSTRYYLVIGTEFFRIVREDAGVATTLYEGNIGTPIGTIFKWRIVHTGSTIIVYRDSGDFVSTGRIGIPMEVARITENVINLPGHVAFSTFSSVATFDNLHIKTAGIALSLPRNVPMRSRRWGAYPGVVSLSTLETSIGKKLPIASCYVNHTGGFPSVAAIDATAGKQNLITVKNNTWTMASVVAGTHDSYYEDLADDIALLPTQTYVRLWPEPNAEWNPWSLGYDDSVYASALTMNLTDHAEYIEGWKHVRAIILDRVPSAKFVWCVNNEDFPKTDLLEDYYPGSSYADVLGFAGFNWGAGDDGATWQTHEEVFRDAYYRLCGVDLYKPIWICETGSKESLTSDGYNISGVYVPTRAPIDAGHSKVTWVNDLMAETGFSRISTVVLYNVHEQRDWRVNSHANTLAEYVAEFAAAATALTTDTPDPELFPQPQKPEYITAAEVGRQEYMRLEEPGYADLILLPSLGGIWVQDSNLGFPEIRNSVMPRGQRSGTLDQTKLHSAKAVSIEVHVAPYLSATVAYQLDLLARWMAPGRRPVLVYCPRGEAERRLALRPANFEVSSPRAHRAHAAGLLTFTATDGSATASATRATALDATDANPTDALTYGTTTAYPVIRIYGPTYNPLLINESLDAVVSSRLGLSIELDADQFAEFDVAERTVQLNGWVDLAANLRSKLTTARWFGLEPFRNSLTLTSDGTTIDDSTVAGTAEIVWHDRYLI